ncbi:MAG: VacJ family lipoprotein [Alphaproteobacteria bacterium]
MRSSWGVGACVLLLALLVAGAAGAEPTGGPGGPVPFSRQQFHKALRESGEDALGGGDSLEAFNRRVFAFNRFAVDQVVDPMSRTLGEWLPDPVKTAGHNVYSNLVEPEFIVTNLMVDDHRQALISTQRFLINSTVGLGGIFDPASRLGLERREVEMAEGLCATGVLPGPYVVLPLIGPTNVTSAGLVTGFFAVEWWLLSWISTTLATADLVVDISASAASLRYARDLPNDRATDPYEAQRAEYRDYIRRGCLSPRPSQTALAR